MKYPLLILSLALTCSLTSKAQTTYKYHFDYGLNEIYATGPELTTITDTSCNGAIISASLPISVTKNVYEFDKGCGFVFNDAGGFLAGGGYTIEMYVKLDTISGYKKLIDFDSLSKDRGVYNRNGKIALYSVFESNDSVFGAGTFNYVAISRDASTKEIYINCNGVTLGTYTDGTDLYVYDSNKRIIFVQDDGGTSGEEASGEIAMIHITDQALDSNTIKTKYTQLGTTLNINNINNKENQVYVYPNPAQDYVTVSTAYECSYTISDITGKVLMKNTARKGEHIINIEQLQTGVYLLQLNTAEGGHRTFKVVKQ